VPVTLELGGKSPQLVFADADLDAALPFLVNAGIQNAGQTCSAASRILVQRPVFDAVSARMAERYRALRVGPALVRPRRRPGDQRGSRRSSPATWPWLRSSGVRILAQPAVPAAAPVAGCRRR
jgi:aldehyde dehydrogenase (NAD+)